MNGAYLDVRDIVTGVALDFVPMALLLHVVQKYAKRMSSKTENSFTVTSCRGRASCLITAGLSKVVCKTCSPTSVSNWWSEKPAAHIFRQSLHS